MIDSIPRIADRIIELLKYRQENNRRFLKEHIEPIHDSIQIIFNDFQAIYQKILTNLNSEEINANDLITHVDEALQKYWDKRWDITHYAEHLKKGNKHPKEVLDFVDAVLAIIYQAEGTYRRSGRLRHFLSELQSVGRFSASEKSAFREHSVRIIEDDNEEMCSSWLKVSDAYHRLRVKCLK